MKKKSAFILGAFSLLAVATTAVAVNFQPLTASGSSDEVYNHYSAKAATLDARGIKEYWVSCSTHETVFTAPSDVQIVDKGVPSQAFIDSLASNDARVLSATRKALTFDDASDADYIYSRRDNFATKEIVDDPETGDKCLALTYNDGTADFMVIRAYMDQAFADPAVKAVAFDAKVTAVTKSTKDVMYRKVGNVIGNYESTNGPDANGYGLQTYWKTFNWTRELYENAVTLYSDIAMLWFTIDTTNTVYVDNIRPVTTDVNCYTFENCRFRNDTTVCYLYDITDTANVFDFDINGQTATAYDSDIKTEGHYSVKVHKAANKQVSIESKGLYALMSEGDVLTFDFRATTALNPNGTIQTGDSTYYGGSNLDANTWYKIQVPYSRISSSGNNTILKMFGSPEYDLYVDNFQIVKAGTNTNGFEAEVVSFDSSTYGNKDTNSVLYNQYSQANQSWTMKVSGYGAIKEARLTTSLKTEGNTALYIVKAKTNEMAFYFGSEICTALNAGKTVSIDVFSTGYVPSTSFVDGVSRGAIGNQPASTWTTYTFDSSKVTSDGRFLIVSGSGSVGTWVIDNIVVNA